MSFTSEVNMLPLPRHCAGGRDQAKAKRAPSKRYHSFDSKKMEWQLTNAFGCREEFDYFHA
jgi:hypothetical protein